MAENQKGILLAVAKLDRKICILKEKKSTSEKRLLECLDAVKKKQQEFKKLESEYKSISLKQVQEEERLRMEEQKIIERRKQITAMGGAKSAKFAERDLDMASKVIESMEQATLELMEGADRLKNSMSVIQEGLLVAEDQLRRDEQEIKPQLEKMFSELNEAAAQREALILKLDTQVKNLYQRVSGRYSADPLSIVTDTSCKACFRTLPIQIYNKVLLDDEIIQCPGCSRILVAETESVEI